ncbi:hypothetical protein [Desulfogranum japonicum]|uniref:hypothetical protein n=1 Tax=Desulfogranum japonicum TaxID=231447 RepID=UPI0004169E79|nr:hypothetical protein [Desulfogranum japonicum]
MHRSASRICIFAALLLLFGPIRAHAASIGIDTDFNITPMQVLVADDAAYASYVEVYNYFFTLSCFWGLFGLWARLLFRIFKL